MSSTSVVCPTHTKPCKRLVVGKDGPNKGRTFYVCLQGGCKFFEWASDPASQSSSSPPPHQQNTEDTHSSPPSQNNPTSKPTEPLKPQSTLSSSLFSTPATSTIPATSTVQTPTPSGSNNQATEPKKRIKLSLFKANVSSSATSRSSHIPNAPSLTHTTSNTTSSTTPNPASTNPPIPATTTSNPTTLDDFTDHTDGNTTVPPLKSAPFFSKYSKQADGTTSSTSTMDPKPKKFPLSGNTSTKPQLNFKSEPKPIKKQPPSPKPPPKLPTPPPSPPSPSFDPSPPSSPPSHHSNYNSDPPITPPRTVNQSPKKAPLAEMKKNAAVLGASPISKPAKPVDEDSAANTTTTTTTTSEETKPKKMLSLEILNGKGERVKPTIAPLKIVRPPGKEQPLEKITVDLEVVTAERVGLTKKIRNKELEEAFMSIPGHHLDHASFKFSFPLDQYALLLQKLRQVGAKVKPVPKEVLLALQTAKARDAKAGDTTTDFTDMPPALFSSLLGFQIEGLMFAARNGGKCLIADEMGLGKTIQALAIASCYRSEWPLLIICPSSMRSPWRAEIEKWLDMHEPQVNVINNGRESLTGQVNIISYELAVRLEDEIKQRKFKVLICDESHYMKSITAERTKVLVPIIQVTPRAILLTGTPALSRPAELFPQLMALHKQMFKSFKDYALRYCSAYKGPYGWDYSGNAHLPELHVILSQTVMIRRLKADVLSDLPGKTRSTVSIDISDEAMEEMRFNLAEAKRLGVLAKQGNNKWADSDKKQMITQLYSETAHAKSGSVCNYVLDLAAQDPDRKFLVFAHHMEMLDAIESALQQKRITHMRIDGSTTHTQRSSNINLFQNSKRPQVAVLSMTAAGTGLTLNAASLVVFAELYWTPGILRQCEDRVHRIGQTSDCDIRYLLAKNTLDDNIWPLICHKLEVVGSTLDGQGEVLEATEMDYIQGSGGMNTFDEDPIDDDDILAAVLPDLAVPRAHRSTPAYISPPPSPDIGSTASKQKGATKAKRKGKAKQEHELENGVGKGKEKKQRKRKGDDMDFGAPTVDPPKKRNPHMNAKQKQQKDADKFFSDNLDYGFGNSMHTPNTTTSNSLDVDELSETETSDKSQRTSYNTKPKQSHAINEEIMDSDGDRKSSRGHAGKGGRSGKSGKSGSKAAVGGFMSRFHNDPSESHISDAVEQIEDSDDGHTRRFKRLRKGTS